MPSAFVLSVGHDPVLLSARRSALQGDGHSVQSATSAAESLKLLTDFDVDVLLLCHTLSARERSEILRPARRQRPSLKILLIAYAPPAEQVDIILHPRDEPRGLLPAIARLLAARCAA